MLSLKMTSIDTSKFLILTSSSMAQVIYDLAFLNAYNSKVLKQKILRKIIFLKNCFLYLFCFEISPYNDAFFIFIENVPKIHKSGHMRPGPWKSCHPTEEK